MSWNFEIKKVNLTKANKLPNMHVHSTWCIHATNTLRSLNKKYESGFSFALNEHMPYPEGFLKNSAQRFNLKSKQLFMVSGIPLSKIDKFISAITKINFPVGFEVDYLEGYEKETINLMKNIENKFEKINKKLNHFSVSIHTLKGYSLFEESSIRKLMEIYPPKDLIELYFKISIDAINKIPCDFICHPGLIELVFKKINLDLDEKLRKFLISQYKLLIDELVKLDIPIEINTSGIKKGLSNPFMPYEVFKYAKNKNTKFVLGSDWHHPKCIYCCFDQLYDFLKKENIKYIYKIIEHKQIKVEI